MKFKEAIEKAKAESKKRNFVQSVELVVNFQNIDFNKADNKINLEVQLPKGRGKNKKICVICDDELSTNAKKNADKVIMAHEIEKVGKDKKLVKKMANEFDFFIAQANLMAQVGKFFGQALGPRGKMPKPVPPAADLTPIVTRLKNTVTIKTKGKNLPVLHIPIGTEAMSDDDLAENASSVLSSITGKVSTQSIKGVFVKESMGPIVQVGE